eukprot:TRINITY_DN28093_c0_g1_i1.p2 TRINITY_DN28093_c0_g1~~TRINITY_DN28093_c0_g1_i1.p2  ORF type:complete len:964 (+),score=156.51 TRINITY_DN28093_c0_g1_i1:427-2892(+)
MDEDAMTITLKFYIDGNFKGTSVVEYSSLPMLSVDSMISLGYPFSNARFNGHYDNFRVFNTTFSGSDVSHFMSNSLSDDEFNNMGMILYWSFDDGALRKVTNQPFFPQGIEGYIYPKTTSCSIISTASTLRKKSTHASSLYSTLRIEASTGRTITIMNQAGYYVNVSLPVTTTATFLPVFADGTRGTVVPSHIPYSAAGIQAMYIHASASFAGAVIGLKVCDQATDSVIYDITLTTTRNIAPVATPQPSDVLVDVHGEKIIRLGHFDNIDQILRSVDLDGDYVFQYITSITPNVGALYQILDGTITKGSMVDWESGAVLSTSMAGELMYSLHAKGVVDNLNVERVAVNYLLSDGLHNSTSVLYLDIRPGIQLPSTFSKSLLEGGSLELTAEKLLPQVTYSTSNVRIVSLPSHGSLYDKSGGTLGNVFALSNWVTFVGQYASSAVASSYLFMKPENSSSLLSIASNGTISGGAVDRLGQTLFDTDYGSMRATSSPDAYTSGYGAHRTSWVASGPEQTDVLEFCVDEAVVPTSIRVFHAWMGGNIVKVTLLGENTRIWYDAYIGSFDPLKNQGSISIFTTELFSTQIPDSSRCGRLYFSSISSFYSNVDAIFISGFLAADAYLLPVDSIIYVPNKNYYGSDSFSFTANIPFGSVSQTIPLVVPTGVFQISVQFVNQAPVIVDGDNAEGITPLKNSFTVTVSDVESSKVNLTFYLLSLPQLGTLSHSITGEGIIIGANNITGTSGNPTLLFNPSCAQRVGRDSFKYLFSDGQLNSTIGTFYITYTCGALSSSSVVPLIVNFLIPVSSIVLGVIAGFVIGGRFYD